MGDIVEIGLSVNQKKLAEINGVTRKTVSQWTKEGLPVEGKKGNSKIFNTATCSKWLIERERKKAKQTTGMPALDLNIKEAKLLEAVSNARMAELNLNIKLEQFIEIDLVVQNLEPVLSGIRTKIVGMTGTLTGKLANQDEVSVQETLEEYASETLGVLEKYEHEFIED